MLAVAVLLIAGYLLNSIWVQLFALGLITLTLIQEGILPLKTIQNTFKQVNRINYTLPKHQPLAQQER
jgi:hypothetical protein